MTATARPAALSATFSDFKLLKTRGVAQLVLEVPIEAADVALEVLGGVPIPGREVHVALARLRPPAPPPPEEPPLERTLDEDGRDAIKAAATLARIPSFQNWLLGGAAQTPFPHDDATDELRRRLGIESRKELRTNVEALKRWRALVADYEAHENRQAPG